MLKVSENKFLEPVLDHVRSSSFLVTCNPPFFGTNDEKLMINKNAITQSCESQFFEGGEVEFAFKIINESLKIDNKCFFTLLLGKKSSIEKLADYLRDKNIHTFGYSQMFQGRTVRWCFYWIRNGDNPTTIQIQRDLSKRIRNKLFITAKIKNLAIEEVREKLFCFFKENDVIASTDTVVLLKNFLRDG